MHLMDEGPAARPVADDLRWGAVLVALDSLTSAIRRMQKGAASRNP